MPTRTPAPERLGPLLDEIAGCRLCAASLAHAPRPVLQAAPEARVLIAGQAPGRRVHTSGVPFDDPSGDRLRSWMGIGLDTFHDPRRVAILPMSFCYPGSSRSGDLPPRPECAAAWRARVLRLLPDIQLTLVLGRYAQEYHLGTRATSVTETVRRWRDFQPATIPLPHPSPRNLGWLRRNEWFERDVIPQVRRRVRELV